VLPCENEFLCKTPLPRFFNNHSGGRILNGEEKHKNHQKREIIRESEEKKGRRKRFGKT
jgi:hypothetical protein